MDVRVRGWLQYIAGARTWAGAGVAGHRRACTMRANDRAAASGRRAVLFPTITFAIFFLLVFTLNWLVMPRFRLWKWFTILVGYVFYAWWDWRFVGLLVVATLVNQAAA